jgi:hypothetical protein
MPRSRIERECLILLIFSILFEVIDEQSLSPCQEGKFDSYQVVIFSGEHRCFIVDLHQTVER